MEYNHVGKSFKSEKNTNSVFTVFSNLTGEQNQNPKYCVELLRILSGNKTFDGVTDNFKYSIKRVVRALGSTRLHSQCGCFACLASLLKTRVCCPQDVINILDKEEQNVQGATKSEIKALNTGVVLACGAIIHSGVFTEQDDSTKVYVLKKIVECGKKKSYLFTVACRFLVDAINLIDDTFFNQSVWPLCKTEILKGLKDYNVDSYHLLAVCMKKNSSLVDKYVKKQYESKNVILECMIRHIFSNSTKSNHPIYGSVADVLCQNYDILKEIWPQFVEEYGKTSSAKDNVLVTLFYHITKCLQDANVIPVLLVPKFIEILTAILNFKKSKIANDIVYHTMAKEALNVIEAKLSGESSSNTIKISTIKKLLLYPANLKFELKTGNKIIQRLIFQLDSASTVKMLELYQKIITDKLKKKGIKEGVEENWNKREKQIALNNLVKILNHPSIKNDVGVKLNQIKFIFSIAFLNKDESLSDFIKYAQECFYKSVMLQMPTLKDLVVLLNQLVAYVNEKIINGNIDMSEVARELWDKQFSAVQKLQQESDNKFFVTVHVLLVYMGLQLFTDENLAKGSIEELLSCYSHLKSVGKKSKKSDKRKSTPEEPHWTEVTVDLILSLLSRENKPWRHVISRIFPQVVVHATPAALQQIIDALDPKSQDAVLEEVNSEEGSEDDESEGSESSLSESGESDLEDGDQEEEKASDQLRMAVREALGYSAGLTDDESVDMDLMDPEEEKRLNESLAEAFRLYRGGSRGKKKKQPKDEEALMHFRLRILDLIEIYVTNGPSMQGCLDLILPLLNVLEFSIKDQHQSPLKTRVEAILKSVTSVKNFSTADNVTQDQIKDLFSSLVDRKDISTLVFVEMSPRISDCATFLVRCCQWLKDEESHVCLVPEYETLLRSFCSSREFKLPMTIFQNVLRMTWKGNFKLIRTLFECIPLTNVRIFKKMQIIQLLQTFYKNEKLHSSCSDILKSEFTEIETNFIRAFVDYLASYEGQESKATEKMYVTLFSQIILLVNAARTNARKHRPEERIRSPWEDLVSALAATDICLGNKKTRSQLANLAKELNVDLPGPREKDRSARKRKSSRESEDESTDEKKEEVAADFKESKKRKKKKLDSKKESRRLRDEHSSEGLTLFKFSSVNMDSLTTSNADSLSP